MASFTLITDGQLSAFKSVVRKKGFAEADFELQEEVFDHGLAWRSRSTTARPCRYEGDVDRRCRRL
jgi:hypothetical protein